MTSLLELAEAWHAAECDIDAGGACILHDDIKQAWMQGYLAAQAQQLFPAGRVTQMSESQGPVFNHTIMGIAPAVDFQNRPIVIMNVLMGGQKDQYRLLPSVARGMSDSLILCSDYSDGLIDDDTYTARSDALREAANL